MSSPSIPDPVTPASAPERSQGIEEGDILLGKDEDPNAPSGRKALQKPSGFTGLEI